MQRQQEHWRRQGRQQLQQLSQLQLLLRKEAVMNFCCCMAIEGCLSWKQMAKVQSLCLGVCAGFTLGSGLEPWLLARTLHVVD